MRRRYRRRPSARYGNGGHAIFGGTGWLFADLLLALALAFLLANTVGAQPPKPSPTTSTSHKDKAKKAGHPEAALDLKYIDITVHDVNSYAAAGGSPSAIAPILSAIRKEGHLNGRSAGLVLLFDGDDGGGFPQWETLDMKVWKFLKGQDTSLFKVAVPRYFLQTGGPSSTVELQVYLFKQS